MGAIVAFYFGGRNQLKAQELCRSIEGTSAANKGIGARVAEASPVAGVVNVVSDYLRSRSGEAAKDWRIFG